MPTRRPWRALRLLVRALGLFALILLIAAAAACPWAGRYLIVDQPLQPADALVVLAGGLTDRWLEGADLYREGYGKTVLLSPGYADPVGDNLRAKGVRYPREVDVVRDALEQLGVPPSAILIMPGGYDNTADEAAGARRIALDRGWRSVIVVTTQYHTRRTLFAFQREFRDTAITVQVRGSRYNNPSPDGWWRSRSDLRWVISELQRLAMYRLGLGR